MMGSRMQRSANAGSISEAAREEETLRYGASLLAESFVNDSPATLDHSLLSVSSDAALTAFAQLAALKLNVERAIVSLFDSKRQYIIAEATNSTAIELGPGDGNPADDAGLALLLSGTAIPRSCGVCEHALDRPAVPDAETGNTLLPISVVADLTLDDRFSHTRPYFNPGSPLRFYAGVPLRSPQGIDIGVCCVLDSDPREGLDTRSQRVLRHMSNLVMTHLQSRVSAESYRRNERMVRGLGSMVEGTGSMSKWRSAPNPESFANVQGQEGALNVEQQRIQGQGPGHVQVQVQVRRPSSPDLARPVPIPTQSAVGTEDESETTPASDSNDTLSTENGRMQTLTSFTSYQGAQEDDDQAVLGSLFSRAANIIRESIEVEGVLFLDAAIESYGGLVPQTDAENQNRSSSSSGEDSPATDDSTAKTLSCRVLGFSTSDASSINGNTAPAAYTSVPDTFLERVLRRYREGQVFNFDDDGAVIWAVSDSEDVSSDGGGAGEKAKSSPNRPRKSDGAYLMWMFPGARSVALVPLWDARKERWFAGGFVWTRARSRIFTAQGEVSYLRAFGSATMAEAARIDVLRESKAKEDVLGSLSHEIRSPLHGVILGMELMHESALTGFQEDVLHTVETCGRTLLDTLDHLLDFTKVNHFMRVPKRRTSVAQVRGISRAVDGRSSIEAGMMSIFSDVSLDLLLEEVVESVYAGFSFQNTSNRWASRERAHSSSSFEQAGTLRRLESVRQMDAADGAPESSRPEAHVDVYLSIDPSVTWAFHAQPGALRRIIMNIFGNALKYTSKGSIIVSLTQEPVPAKRKTRRRTIVFSVSDAGRGISPDYLQNRLFTPFAQENQLSSGAGLGLSLVKQIIHGLGGRISVESRVGQGTTVRILIPLRMSCPQTTPTTRPSLDDTDYSNLLMKLGETSVALLGFSDDFAADRPLTAQRADSQLSPRLFMEALCQQHLHLEVVSELETAFKTPSLYICTQSALDQIPYSGGNPPPVVVLCDSILSAHELTARFSADPPHIVRECTSQPVGPRKLAKILVFALERRKRAVSQAPSPTTGLTLHSPTTPTKMNGGFYGGPTVTSPEVYGNSSTSVALLHRSQAETAASTQPGGTIASPGFALSTPSTRENQSQPPSPPTLGGSADFLLVDDNAINLKILASYMKKLGRSHDDAANGFEALQACRGRLVSYRCIFMDISMPVMDGLESTRQIRAYEKQKQLKPAFIIALTGLASAKTQQEAFASGIDLFLTKPVPLKELGRILEAQGV